ncbi:NAD(P)H-dependent oxidoreductase [Testudinibacter sp. TR-2022]|uniref:NAD(P)H-dependent oxidoreductase n=1 Tax=Testudinibacter sp. TR-2022 TaxID=2585029 RepID=UPI00111810DB|nr:NAD(P)H-dependent oxidoreductase [Testudinibacter sp. TR-2022]TNH06793.1 NAD(P)H-dependent oxidoreductase [Pasteurellaceae bacterium Phil11]TNH24123.1 NAD(P)H-dependent oxidoreductase [Testudinibacter sp. TR-2022]TNH27592.1 NAD(P)H-dependent oxidoreductase [Testudinibacter sp. TR-2022]
MAKTLVIIAHPDLSKSLVNQRLADEIKKYPEEFTVHYLNEIYPDGNINVAAEQKLIERHQNVVFQFPIYWFSSPPLLKAWQDQVLTYGWAYGSKGNAFVGRKLALAVSAGAGEESYVKTEQGGNSMEEVLLPFQLSADYIKADYQSPFVFYGLDSTIDRASTAEELADLERGAQDYVDYLRSL